MTRPVALVTGTVSPYRREPFELLADAEGLEVITHGAPGATGTLAVHAETQLGAARLVASRRYRAVICGLGGRVALPATYAAARRARIPFVLWASLWAHPRTAFHALSWPATRHLYGHADAVVTYGPHVTRYVKRHRRTGRVFEAPQSVSHAVFGRTVTDDERKAARERIGAAPDDLAVLYVGRLEREKGIATLLQAWRIAALDDAVLAIAGTGPHSASVSAAAGERVRLLGELPQEALPPFYATAETLVLPSIRTATFAEPWGLVVNEAMLQGTPPIASDAVGAVLGGLVRDGRNGLVFRAGDADALAARMRAMATNPSLRERLGAAARADVAAYTPAAWVDGMRCALRSVGASGVRTCC